MLATVRAAKGQGNSALYVRFRDVLGRYWDLVALGWSGTEVANVKQFLTEFPDSDLLESRYQATVVVPAGPLTTEYVQAASGRVLAEEGDGYLTQRLATDIVGPLGRVLALNGANRVVDQEVLDVATRRVLSARIRTYDVAADAISSGTFGLLATYTVSASYGPLGQATVLITEQLP